MSDRFKELSQNAVKELAEVFDRIGDADVEPLLKAIEDHQRIFTLGAGREGLGVRAFTMRLMHLGKDAHWAWDDTTPAINPGDLFICACGSADVGHENYMCEQAKNAGATLLLVTASGEGVLTKIADTVVKVPAAAYRATGDFVKSTQLMGNLFEQTLLIYFDMIVMALRERLGIKAEEMVARHRNIE